jgi:hypothetical protein
MQYTEKLHIQTCICAQILSIIQDMQKGCSIHCLVLHWCYGDDSLKEEMELLKQAFKNNCKSSWVIQQALHTKNERQTTTKKPAGVALLPYHHSKSN